MFYKSSFKKNRRAKDLGWSFLAVAMLFFVGLFHSVGFKEEKTIEALKNGTQAVISDGEIKTLQDLCSGRVKSGRMYLWHNPGVSLKLMQRLKPLMFHFADEKFDELTERIGSCSGIDKLIMKGEFQFLDLVFDVLVPEVTIKWLEKWEGMNRYAAEKAMLQRIHFYPKFNSIQFKNTLLIPEGN